MKSAAVWVLVCAGALFLGDAFRKGWTRVESDFPNYYTAAVLARDRMPLERFYDWPWFQRQMNYAGIERQLGGYIPQTPVTMIPMLPMAGLAPQNAKRVWLLLNLIFLAMASWWISRLTRFPVGVVLLMALAGFASLASNFLLGQYYVFLLFLLTAAVWCLDRERSFAGGFWLGVICMLKVYTAPFFLYFAWKRQWRALAGMAAACVGLGAASVAWFGWSANVYYLTYVLSRACENAILDPFHPATGTFTNLLRRTFVAEPELNPHPLFEAPVAFYFLRPLLTMMVLALPLLCMRRAGRREVAWFLVAIMLASPNTASYVFVMLLLPVMLLMENADWKWTSLVAAIYVLLCLPLWPAWSWLFPKVWLLAILYIGAGWGLWRNLRMRALVWTAAVIAMISAWDAYRHREPLQKFEAVEMREGSIYASRPAVSSAGVVFESMGADGYILNRDLKFDGFAFHPSVPAGGSPIVFELTARGHSRVMAYDPKAKTLEALTVESMNATDPVVTLRGDRVAFISDGRLNVLGEGAIGTPGPVRDAAWFPDGTHLAFSANGLVYDSKNMRPLAASIDGDQSEPAVAPDGGKLALTVTRWGHRQVWVYDLGSGSAKEITRGNCNSYAAAWEPDSHALVFASDCGRGLGLPRLYRAGSQ
jgi:hypothetical protein